MNKIVIKKYPAVCPTNPPTMVRIDDEAGYILQIITKKHGMSGRYFVSELIKQVYQQDIIEFMEVK